jgi:3-methylfumaryl-CoA hydratase
MSDEEFQSWIGRTETIGDHAGPGPLIRLAALLDHEKSPWEPGELPPLAHWLYFLPRARQSRLDADGHPQRGGLLPMVPLPRRMWAGGRLEIRRPIEVGAELTKLSTIQSITQKTGKSGDMVFVTVRHEISANATLCIVEEQDIVYRDRPLTPPIALPAVAAIRPAATHTTIIHPDPVLLFRFSALTFNSHRIHYDRDYARDVEGYQGLVVHGPLIATLLMDHFLRQNAERRISRFSFRAQNPLFDTAPFTLFSAPSETGVDLWAATEDGPVAMQAHIQCA